MYQYDESDDYQIISENLNRTDESISHGFEMRKAHLKDLAAVFSGELIKNSGYADVMDAVCLSDESTGMYEKSIRFAPHNAFGSANETDFTSFSKTISKFWGNLSIILCVNFLFHFLDRCISILFIYLIVDFIFNQKYMN